MRHQIESSQLLDQELKLNADYVARMEFRENTDRKGLLYNYEKQARNHHFFIINIMNFYFSEVTKR